MSSQNRIGLILIAIVGISVAALAFSSRDSRDAETGTSLGDVSVACGPSQRAMVQKTGAGSSAQVLVSCVDTGESQQIAYAPQAAAPLTPVSYASAPGALVPAVMYAPEEPAVRSAPAVRTQRAASAPARQVERRPSWQKRLLIIGGSSGAGAGIGALVGGKKGALIGAAIGGGGAAVVDQVKNR